MGSPGRLFNTGKRILPFEWAVNDFTKEKGGFS
jgi:hypothetical protein